LISNKIIQKPKEELPPPISVYTNRILPQKKTNINVNKAA